MHLLRLVIEEKEFTRNYLLQERVISNSIMTIMLLNHIVINQRYIYLRKQVSQLKVNYT